MQIQLVDGGISNNTVNSKDVDITKTIDLSTIAFPLDLRLTVSPGAFLLKFFIIFVFM